MPFILVDEKKKATSDGNSFDELPPGVTPDELSKLIVAGVSEQIIARTQEALHAALYIEQPSGVVVCKLTGRIVD